MIVLPTSDHERIDSSVRDEPPNSNDWHPYKGKFWGLEGDWASLEQNDWCLSTISNGICFLFCVEFLRPSQPNGVMLSAVSLFVCVEVLRPSQPNGVMLSAVSLPNHTFTGQA